MAQREIRIKTVEDGIDGAPPWITTFVDMTSLLVTFFILLFTFQLFLPNVLIYFLKLLLFKIPYQLRPYSLVTLN